MKKVRATLERLGWPIDDMTDQQITSELYRRWFRQPPHYADDTEPANTISARGIVSTLATEGNLDALCWSPDDVVPTDNFVPETDADLFNRSESEEDYPHPDRRESQRESASEFVRWEAADNRSTTATGWLVDRSERGLAFIAQTDQAPPTGSQIVPSVCSREDETQDLGLAVVVRTEQLNAELTLVCARLEEEFWPQI